MPLKLLKHWIIHSNLLLKNYYNLLLYSDEGGTFANFPELNIY